MPKKKKNRDTAGFALFLSTFTSSYKGILCGMRHLRKTSDIKSDKLNAFVAGSLAGLALAFDRDKHRRQSIMLYLFTRALQFNGAWLMKKWAIKRKKTHPGQTKWDDHLAKYLSRYSGVGVMMIASAQLIYAFLFNYETLPKSYFAFLLTQAGFKKNFGGMAGRVAEAVGITINQLAEDKSSVKIPVGVSARDFVSQCISPNIGTAINPKLNHEYIICALQHPLTDSCMGDKVSLFKDQLLRSLKMYVPLNVVSIFYFRVLVI